VREVLEAIYEQGFLDCSYGFRPKRSAHDAIRTLDRIVHRGEVNRTLEADMVSFFDSLDRKKLKEMLEVLQAAQCEPETGDPVRLRWVSSPSTPPDRAVRFASGGWRRWPGICGRRYPAVRLPSATTTTSITRSAG
jgi:hypothetical protein